MDLELKMSINTKGSPMEMDEEKKPNPFWHLGIYVVRFVKKNTNILHPL